MVAGAFGSHGLKKKSGITTDGIHAWETASHYIVCRQTILLSAFVMANCSQIYNGLALLLISLHPRFSAKKLAGPAIAIGGAVFSVSIMAMVLSRDWCCLLLRNQTTYRYPQRARVLGPVTPVGGSVMIAGSVPY